MGEEERAGRGVIELVAIVALNCLDRGIKLCAHIREKVRKDAKGIGLEASRKRLGVVSAIIQNDKMIFIARH